VLISNFCICVSVNTVEENRKRAANEALFNLVSLDEEKKKESESAGKAMDKALFQIIKQQAEKKSVSSKEDLSVNAVTNNMKKEAETRLLQLLAKKESTKKGSADSTTNESAAVNDALFDLLKERVLKREKDAQKAH